MRPEVTGPVVPLLAGRPAPLRVMVLVSATGANLSTLLDLATARPDLVEVVLVASDRTRTPALAVARAAGVTTWPGNFERECGRFGDCVTEEQRRGYRERAAGFHDRLCARVEEFEAAEGEIDLVVLAYHRWVHGRFLAKFGRRIINQHPADLAELDRHGRRALVGLDPVLLALTQGHEYTRTSTFLVDDTHDGGAVLARGPLVRYTGRRPPTRAEATAHEHRQKRDSDRPVLRWTVTALAEGRLGLDESTRHPDGSVTVTVDGNPLPLGGFSLTGRDAAR